MRIFRASRRQRVDALSRPARDTTTASATSTMTVTRTVPPANPVELGLALRSGRERANLSLEQVRDQIDVPLFDLDALERGALELLHLEQSAVVAIWRYADLLGLDPDVLVSVARTFWPNRALAIDTFRVPLGGSSPLSHLQAASQLLQPISHPRALPAGTRDMGLSSETLQLLAQAVGKASLRLESGGPIRWSTPQLSEPEPQPSIGGVGVLTAEPETEVVFDAYETSAIADPVVESDGLAWEYDADSNASGEQAEAVLSSEPAAAVPEVQGEAEADEPAATEQDYRFSEDYRFTE